MSKDLHQQIISIASQRMIASGKDREWLVDKVLQLIEQNYTPNTEVERRVLETKIDELSNVQLEHGRYLTQTFVAGQSLTIEERIDDLQQQLTKLKEKEE